MCGDERTEKGCAYFDIVEDEVRKDFFLSQRTKELIREHEIVLQQSSVSLQDISFSRVCHSFSLRHVDSYCVVVVVVVLTFNDIEKAFFFLSGRLSSNGAFSPPLETLPLHVWKQNSRHR